jgi:hypothetical protein
MDKPPITDHGWQYCPVESSPLLYLGFEPPSSLLHGVVKYYCPRCDLAFIAVTTKDPLRLETAGLIDVIEILTWKRVEGEFQLVGEKPTGYFSEQQWEERRKDLFQHVQRLLAERTMMERQQLPCLFEGQNIPVICNYEDPDLAFPITIAWCESCKLGFAYVRDSDYGWEAVCTYEWDARNQHYELAELIRHRGTLHLSRYSCGSIAKYFPPPPGAGPP